MRLSRCTVLVSAWLSVTGPAAADFPGVPSLSARAVDPASAPVPGSPASTPAAPAEPLVVAETAYRTFAAPRAEGAVVASVADEETARWNVGGTSRPDHVSNKPGFHAAPRVLVETKVRSGRLPVRSRKRGVLSEAAILAQTRSQGYWPIRLCYEASLRGEPKLRGKVLVRVTIGRGGRISASRVVAAQPSLRPVASCVAERIRRPSYTPAPPRRTDVDVAIELSPGDAPLPGAVPGPSPVAPGSPPVEPRLWVDPKPAAAAFEPVMARVRGCYATAQAQDAGLWGRLALRLRLDEVGRVVEVTEHESRFPSLDVFACARAALHGLGLPPALGGAADLVWTLRLGHPPPEASPATPGNPPPVAIPQGTVAESPPVRVRVAP